MSSVTPVLEARGLGKSYGAVDALRGVELVVRAGEVVALCGDNGAGKSTLVKAISGTAPADRGQIIFAGRDVRIDSPHTATALGIATVYQDLALSDNLDIVSNLFLGRELVRRPRLGRIGVLKTAEMFAEAEATLATLSVTLPELSTPISALSGGQRQSVAVARAVLWGSQLVLLDEPTAALGVEQTGQVLAMIRRLADSGVGVILISHSMPDVFAVSDRIVVLRLGEMVGEFVTAETNERDVIAAITGATKGGVL